MKTFFQTRPLSWSALSSFEYSPEQWHRRYILNEPVKENPEMLFGKAFAKANEDRKPLAPVTLYNESEYEFKVVYNGYCTIGFLDTFCSKTKRKILDHKTGVKPWDQKRANETGQLKMYALQNFITNKVRPEECSFAIEWVPTRKIERDNGDFSGHDYTIDFVYPITVLHFDVKITMSDILAFGARINKVVKEMEQYVASQSRIVIPSSRLA